MKEGGGKERLARGGNDRLRVNERGRKGLNLLQKGAAVRQPKLTSKGVICLPSTEGLKGGRELRERMDMKGEEGWGATKRRDMGRGGE